MNPYTLGENKIFASVVQSCSAAYSLDDTLDKLEHYTRLAKSRDNSQLIVFPEALCVCSV
jgi:predicted amidohydrolase